MEKTMINRQNYQQVGGGLDVDSMWPAKEKKPGDGVEGRYVEIAKDFGPNHSNVYVLETSDGKRVGVWGSTVIDGRFEKIAIGKMVGIEYVGEERGKSGKTYQNYWVGAGIDTVGDEGGKEKPNASDDTLIIEEGEETQIPF